MSESKSEPFAYSFDRETFRGEFPTRAAALNAAVESLSQSNSDSSVIFIGKRTPIDPGTAGLGEVVVSAVRRRLHDSLGESASESLSRVSEKCVAQLDLKLESLVCGWMAENNLMPLQSKVIAISEHAAPQMATMGIE